MNIPGSIHDIFINKIIKCFLKILNQDFKLANDFFSALRVNGTGWIKSVKDWKLKKNIMTIRTNKLRPLVNQCYDSKIYFIFFRS